MADLEKYRQEEIEQERIRDLLSLLPHGRRTVLEIGALDGFHTRMLAERFESVTALDLEKPKFSMDRVTTVKGDVTALEFADNSFDCVFCAEVLEHVPIVDRAASEISRVVKNEVVIGVPYKQDTRFGKLTCSSCGEVNPVYGHVNRFDEKRLRGLFPRLEQIRTNWVGTEHGRTNAISSWLSTLAGNPWGTYDQDFPCVFCGVMMKPPARLSFPHKVASRLACDLERVQRAFTRLGPAWIHVLYRKPNSHQGSGG